MRLICIVIINFALSVCNEAFGQTMSTIHPRAGDTLRVQVDHLPNYIQISGSGPEQSWDLTGLQSPFVYVRACLPPGQGEYSSYFVDADLMIRESNDKEVYFRNINGVQHELGYSGMDPLGFGLRGVYRYENPLPQGPVTMRYERSHDYQTELIFALPKDLVPEEWSRRFPYSPDTIRIRIEHSIKVEYDSWGVVSLPNGPFPTIRERRTQVSRKVIEIKRENIPWQDVTSLLEGERQIRMDSTVEFRYYNENFVGPLVRVLVDPASGEAQKVLFWSEKQDRMPEVESLDRPGIFAYPNPNFGFFRIDILNLRAGFYSLKIFDLLGEEILLERHYITTVKTIEVNLSERLKGTYFYTLLDEEGRHVITKRLVIFRP